MTDSKTIGIHFLIFLTIVGIFTPLEIMPRSVSSPAIAGLEFLMGFTLNLSSQFFLLGMGEDIFWFLDDLFLS